MIQAPWKIAFRKFRRAETRLHELNYLFWELTRRCNLNCLHCGSDCSRGSKTEDMPVQVFLNAADTIKPVPHNFIVVLTGGEPLVRNDVEKCGLELRKRGMRWGIVTNGYLYSKERHISLLNAGMGALTISLDGLEGSHNWLRQNSRSFEKATEAIRLAAGSKRLNFDVVTCVNKRNLNELPEILSLLTQYGVKAWRLFTITPAGRAVNTPDLFLTAPEFREMMEFICESRCQGKTDVKFSCEGYVGEYELKVRDSFFFCRAGINIASVLHDGSISACPNIDRSFVQGNIYSENLFNVWQTRFGQMRDKSWTRTGQCSSCEDYTDCLGNGLHNWQGNMKNIAVCHKDLCSQ